MKRAESVDKVLTQAADLRSEIHQTKIAAQQIADSAAAKRRIRESSRSPSRRRLTRSRRGTTTCARRSRTVRCRTRPGPYLTGPPHGLDAGIARMADEARMLAEQVQSGETHPAVDHLLKPHGHYETNGHGADMKMPAASHGGMSMPAADDGDDAGFEDPHGAITAFIGFLRQQADYDRRQVSNVHSSLLVATLLVLLVEIFVVFRPLTTAARSEAHSAAAAEEELHWLATHDPLTGLCNRHSFECRLEELISEGRPFALLLADLDRFKAVNDEYGHQAGDQVLKEVASRLAPVLRKGDFAARLGGDEFVVILRDCETAEDCLHVAQRIKSETERPILLGASRAAIGFSAGCALWPVHGADSRDIIAAADLTMYHAKKSAMTQCLVFDPSFWPPRRKPPGGATSCARRSAAAPSRRSTRMWCGSIRASPCGSRRWRAGPPKTAANAGQFPRRHEEGRADGRFDTRHGGGRCEGHRAVAQGRG